MKEFIKNFFPEDRKKRWIWIGMLIFTFLIGMILSGGGEESLEHNHAGEDSKATTWTCSMHPQIQQPNPGQCPICGMDLIPVSSGGETTEGLRDIVLSEAAQKLASIEVAPVERKFVSSEIRLVGKIEYDETRLKYITAWVPGRIERMFVDFTGARVRRGDHLVELYSPELLSTQQELIQTANTLKSGGSEMMKQNLTAVRERLRLWGLTNKQINNIISNGKVSERITIYSPINGVVIKKDGLEGMYVKTGSRIYSIADLSNVWVKMDAYESDLPWIRYGQKVEFETETNPGEFFNGKIAFIDPILNEKTRTVKVRVNVKNTDGKLKPGMFIRATVHSKIAAGGKVMDPELSGKWISPMHPEVVKNKPGKCDVCGMDLVQAESLGYVSTDKVQKEASLVIPASAPLITGKRAVVYVQVKGKEGMFEGREVVLGPRAGDYYIVKEGLKEGELVVVNGNFKIDSAIQILAKPSMMNPEVGAAPSGHNHGQQPIKSNKAANMKKNSSADIPANFQSQLDHVYQAYFKVHDALSHDNIEGTKKAAKTITDHLKKVDMGLLSREIHMVWMDNLKILKGSIQQIKKSPNLEEARMAFEIMSNTLISVSKQFGVSGNQPVFQYHCPMAFDGKGADWLQNKEGTENPYYGSKMFKCGSKTFYFSSKNIMKQAGGREHE